MPEWVRTPLIIFGTLPLFFATMLAVESTRAAEEALLVSGPAWAVGVTWWLLAPVRLDARRARRARLGQCTRCGYDLTANVSGVCPECGGFT